MSSPPLPPPSTPSSLPYHPSPFPHHNCLQSPHHHPCHTTPFLFHTTSASTLHTIISRIPPPMTTPSLPPTLYPITITPLPIPVQYHHFIHLATTSSFNTVP
ncbi:hypothetical protein E2C01_099849 [Portunus trituberculatus]|uniref:Uncharacterized protein n=1 Tax=Portunus trituberculatus TaxID=210409 RepID=A0A5B7KHV9_PORTR|nr:hypothetical protein [Portunus trituberculatus]